MIQEKKIEKQGEEFFGIDPTGKSPAQIELEWFENYYHGEIPQLTVRAVLVGAIALGALAALDLGDGLDPAEPTITEPPTPEAPTPVVTGFDSRNIVVIGEGESVPANPPRGATR